MSRRLRVVFCLANGGIGGTELNAVRTAERLDRNRFDLEVVALDEYPPLRRRYESAGIPFRVFDPKSLKSLHAVRVGWRLASHLRARRVDVFHAHDLPGDIFGIPWARLAGVPVVIASRRWWLRGDAPGHDMWARVAFRMAHAVIANTPRVAERTALEGVAPEKIWTVPNFLDEDSFSAPHPRIGDELRGRFHIGPAAKVVGIVAQLRPEKDHATLLRAAARLADRHPDVHFVLVGEGNLRGDIEALRADLGLEARVHLTGQRHGEGNLHHLFDVSVLCSRSEALSNSILEAMAAGNPIVASAVGGNPDPVTDEETGLLFPVGDSEALAAGLDRLLSDSTLSGRLGQAGRERARREYTPGVALATLDRIYRSLLSERRGTVVADSAVAA